MRKWFVRGNVRLQPEQGDDPESRAGATRRLSLRSVLTLAATSALARSYVPVKQAFEAARDWTFIAHATADRIPAGLFAEPAWSFLIYCPNDRARVVAVTSDRESGWLPFNFSDLFATGHPVRQSPTIVFLNSVDRHARNVCEGFLR